MTFLLLMIALFLKCFCVKLLNVLYSFQEHEKVEFISFRKRLSLAARKYLVLILLAIFLFAGFVSTYFGILHWGGISYGVACMLLVQNVSHYMTALRLYAPQLYIFEKAVSILFVCLLL